ncbi:MAG: hydroxymethylbilane synthase [Bacillota bacterium]|nr:hydroxymethylbilane synthase [Bacillota bacterium]
MRQIIVGTRGSRLAVTQTEWVISKLQEKWEDHEFVLKVIITKGDQIQTTPLDKIGDKGLFTRAIEDQLKTGDIDFAVHSLKDLPSHFEPELSLASVPVREDARDVLVLREGFKTLDDLPAGARIGTGSKRRLYQLMRIRPDIVPVPIRGNVETRINKITKESLDGVILAAAGMHRLGIKEKITQYLDVDLIVPAPAQGALGLQYRTNDNHVKMLLNSICDEVSEVCVRAERAFLEAIEGSCHIPIGAYATLNGRQLKLMTVFGDAEGLELYKTEFVDDRDHAEELGKKAAEDTLKKMFSDVMISLVGAGPGDEGLITIKAVDRLKSCDAVVYDRLAAPAFLKYVPEHAVKIYVGKAASDHAMTQEEINRTLEKLAKSHKRIVRLKGGDPFVFGRGGEEAIHLNSKGIPFEVVPGITSPISGLAYAGIPITHRDVAASFHVFTGHFNSEEKRLDFDTISKLEGTLVFLMSISQFKNICSELIGKGKNPKTPIAVVSSATLGNQMVYETTMDDADSISGVASPAFLAVGDVISLRKDLNWFEKRPLFGKKILVTRASALASSFSEKLRHLGATVIESPSIELYEVDQGPLLNQFDQLKSFTHLWFTSASGVKLFFKALQERGMDSRQLSHLKVLAIGTSTASSLIRYGIKADYIPEQFTQEGIVKLMKPLISRKDKILLPGAEDIRTLLSDTFASICDFVHIPIYRTCPSTAMEITAETLSQVDYITFTSGSSVKYFHEYLLSHDFKIEDDKILVSIGPITTDVLMEMGYKAVVTSRRHTIDGMIETIISEENKNGSIVHL